MKIISLALVILGACIMLYSISKYLRLLSDLRNMTNQKKLLSNWMYTSCLLLLTFFLAGYIAFGVSLFMSSDVTNVQLLVAAVFFFGAIFVLNMVTVVNRMIHSDISSGLVEDRLAQQELMSDIAADFITNVPLDELISKSLTKLGEYTDLDRILLSKADFENDQLLVQYDWVNKNPNNTTNRPNSIPFHSGRFYYDSFITEKKPYIKEIFGEFWNLITVVVHINGAIVRNTLAIYSLVFSQVWLNVSN